MKPKGYPKVKTVRRHVAGEDWLMPLYALRPGRGFNPCLDNGVVYFSLDSESEALDYARAYAEKEMKRYA